MIFLVDKKLVPPSGIFQFELLSQEQFTALVKKHLDEGTCDSRIIDPEIIEALRGFTGENIPLCSLSKGNEEITVNTGSSLVMCNLYSESPITELGEDIKLKIMVIMATHYDTTPGGGVALLKALCEQSGMDPIKFWRQVSKEITNQVPLKDVQG